MTGSVTFSVRSADFQRTFVAMRYFWGARGEALAEPLGEVGLQAAAADLVSGLGLAERAERARALAAELGRLSAALDERGLGR
jgi:hypothetical protein